MQAAVAEQEALVQILWEALAVQVVVEFRYP
jgi:hypothetical protein